jgi:hypothetical protein
LTGLLVLLGLSCGDSAPPICPTGNCTLPGSTVVKWKFNHFPAMGFDSDACSDLGVITVHVDVTNTADGTLMDALDKSCGEGQATFSGLEAGMYNIAVTPLDVDGNALVTGPATGTVAAADAGSSNTAEVDVNYPLWKGPYTGQLLFRLKWGGMSCPANVATETVTLTAGGAVRHEVSQIDNVDFQKMDGTDSKACPPFTAMFPMNVMGLPFGPATLLVIGKDAGSIVTFQHTFDTFIGAGVFNPTLEYDSPVMDAGIDAPPDAPPDTM